MLKSKFKVESICTNKYTGIEDHVKCNFDCPGKIMPIYTRDSLFNKLLRYTPSQINILNSFIGYANINKHVYPSQSTIADKVGICRQTTNKLLKRIEKDQLLHRHYRHRNTSIYKLNDLFFIPAYREYLSELLPALKYFCFFVLFSINAGVQQGDTINTKIFNNSRVDFQDTKSFKNKERWEQIQWRMAVEQPMVMPRCLSKKEGKVMKPSILIPEFIENITEVGLTFDDKLELSVFSGPIIDYARKVIVKSGKVANPVAYFKAICRKQQEQRQAKTPTFSKKTTQPSVKEQPSRMEYAKHKYNNLKYMYEMTTNSEAKARLFTQLQQQAQKITDLDEQQPTRDNDTIAASWQKSPEELAEMKARGLANVKDQGMREYLSLLFDASVKQYSVRDKTSRVESDILQEPIKNSNIAPEFDVEIDDYEYDPINTHHLFGD
jgi:hypothetical protein